MCGIAGWISFQKEIDEKIFTEMRDTLHHRGPDDAGNYLTSNQKIALGHRRLSFLDLSPSGHQPMSNEDGRIWIVLNGEIYNFKELRQELELSKHQFKSTSDTEVLIHGYEEWGIDGLLQRIKGMFAFALLDEKKDKLFLVRDRFGIKPLYYHSSPENFIFGSELKAIIKSGMVPKEVDFSSFADYFVYRYIPSPKTIWKNVRKVPPAFYLTVDTKTGDVAETEYWKLQFGNKKGNSKALADEIGEMLEQSVSIHSRSDVEVGSFLSGGYDSSAIVAYLSGIKNNVKCFSIGFEGWKSSEHQFAEMVADKYDGQLSTCIVGSESLDVLKMLANVYDEPIADISIIPTYIVSELASKQVKAVMSGEGADELFGGYTWQKEYFAKWHPDKFLDKLKNLAVSRYASAVDEYAEYMSMGRFDEQELQQLLHPDYHKEINTDSDWFYRKNYNKKLSPMKSFQQMDMKCFMGELVLTKIDRASMAHSLEVRVPFLDHELFEKVMKFDEQVYFKTTSTKYLLYENIKTKLPQQVLERGKQGFVGPDSYYMNLDWYRDIILDGKLLNEKIINKEYIDRLFKEKDHWRLWKVAVMENWWREWMVKV